MAKRVLIVEDDPDLHGMFRHALILADFDVQHAADGLAALRIMDSSPPDVVVLDLGLPTVSGEEVLGQMATRPHARNVPVVVITGRSGDYGELDVACVLRKPVTASRLVAEVLRAVASRRTDSQP